MSEKDCCLHRSDPRELSDLRIFASGATSNDSPLPQQPQTCLAEVRVLLRFRDDPGAACGDVNALDAHISQVYERIKELHLLQKQLQKYANAVLRSELLNICGILAKPKMSTFRFIRMTVIAKA